MLCRIGCRSNHRRPTHNSRASNPKNASASDWTHCPVFHATSKSLLENKKISTTQTRHPADDKARVAESLFKMPLCYWSTKLPKIKTSPKRSNISATPANQQGHGSPRESSRQTASPMIGPWWPLCSLRAVASTNQKTKYTAPPKTCQRVKPITHYTFVIFVARLQFGRRRGCLVRAIAQ